MQIVILSGPASSRQQARTALATRGMAVAPVDHDHGLPARADGTEGREPQAFITVHDVHIDHAADAVRPLGWVLRMHYETEPPQPTEADQLRAELAAMQREIQALKAKVSR